MQIAQLTYLDEHAMDIATGIEEVWPVLIEAVDITYCADCRPVVSTGSSLLARAATSSRSGASSGRSSVDRNRNAGHPADGLNVHVRTPSSNDATVAVTAPRTGSC